MHIVPFIVTLVATFHHQTNSANASKLRTTKRLGSRGLETSSCIDAGPVVYTNYDECNSACQGGVSECASHPTVAGSYHCECTSGYEGTAGLGHCPGGCTDIDECLLSVDILDAINKTPCKGTDDFLCVNSVGHYGCVDACATITNDATMDNKYGDECRDGHMTTQCEVMNRMATADYESLFGAVACSGDKFLCVDLDGGVGYKCVDPCDELEKDASVSYSCPAGSQAGICDVMEGMGGGGAFETKFGLSECPNGTPCHSCSRDGGYTCAPATCGTGKSRDPNTCDCVCDGACPNPSFQIQNSETCECTCLISPDCAQSDSAFQTKKIIQNCECVCPNDVDETCDSGWTYNSAECGCKKDLVFCLPGTCLSGQQFNTDTCQCESCGTTCTAPKVFGQFGCNCVCPNSACQTGYEADQDDPSCTTCKACPADMCAFAGGYKEGGGCECKTPPLLQPLPPLTGLPPLPGPP